MKKPKITVYKVGEDYIYNCEIANEVHRKYHGSNTIYLKAIFYILNLIFILEKDENGQYLHKTQYDK